MTREELYKKVSKIFEVEDEIESYVYREKSFNDLNNFGKQKRAREYVNNLLALGLSTKPEFIDELNEMVKFGKFKQEDVKVASNGWLYRQLPDGRHEYVSALLQPMGFTDAEELQLLNMDIDKLAAGNVSTEEAAVLDKLNGSAIRDERDCTAYLEEGVSVEDYLSKNAYKQGVKNFVYSMEAAKVMVEAKEQFPDQDIPEDFLGAAAEKRAKLDMAVSSVEEQVSLNPRDL